VKTLSIGPKVIRIAGRLIALAGAGLVAMQMAGA
jgi:hypothetical protein